MKSAITVFLLKLFSLVPLPVLHRLGEGIGWVFARIDNRHRFRTRVNLEMCMPELTDEAREDLELKSLQESIKAILEVGAIWNKPVDKVMRLIKSEQNIELLHQALSDPKGLLIITPHLGNWEILAFYFSGMRPVTAMYKPSGLAGVDQMVRDARERTGTELVSTSFAGIARVRKSLEQGGITIILPDQQPELRESGQFVPFFGVPALSMKLVPALVQKTGARVLAVYAKRLNRGRGFEIVFRQPVAEVYSPDLDKAITAVNSTMELCIRDAPSQYHWEYPRFRRDEQGVYLYKEYAKRIGK